MKRSSSTEKSNILEEPYKGPGPIVASAGYVSLYHWVAMVVGFVVCGALGMLAAKPTIAAKEMFGEFSQANKSSTNWFKKIPAHIAGWIPRSADYIAHKVVSLGKNIVRGNMAPKPMSEQKLSAFMFAGGVGGAVGWIGSTIWGIIQGGHEGNIGKRQFENAKAEIKDLRAQLALEKKPAEVSTQPDIAAPTATAESEPEKLSPQTRHTTSEHHEKPAHSIHADAHDTTEHHGKLHAHSPHEQALSAHA